MASGQCTENLAATRGDAETELRRRHFELGIDESSLAEYHLRPRMIHGCPRSGDQWPAAQTRSARRSDRCRRHSIWATVVILGCASVSGAQPEPRQVLLLYSYERDVASHNAFANMFRPELSRLFAEPIDFIEVSLQAARLNPSASEESIVNELRSTLPRRRLDLVVPIGGPAAVFAQTYRQQLFPTTPMLLAGVDRRFVQNRALAANDTAVAVEHDPPQMIETILRLLPDTRTVFVVIGASQFEQFWLEELKRGLRRFEGRLTFIWTNELSFEEMLKACASLPPQSAIFYGTLSLDAKGVRHVEERTLSAFHAAANAPIFGLHSTQLGRGIVGGPLLSIEDLSRNTATVAVRMLRGESPQSLTAPCRLRRRRPSTGASCAAGALARIGCSQAASCYFASRRRGNDINLRSSRAPPSGASRRCS